MNTRNWQIRILTLCMAAFTLCVAAACGDGLNDEVSRPKEATEAPTKEPTEYI